ncbi:hypothetical protein ABTZ59_34570 [Streptomyces sp. NPDC094034]|uniref:hypothetical protein n=1 Tax=Streptomyces sp. NPDC094034 TaxID=3155309 RepID=UPI003322657A
MAVTKLVDILVEPLAHTDGLSLYENQSCLALAELLRMTGPGPRRRRSGRECVRKCGVGGIQGL